MNLKRTQYKIEACLSRATRREGFLLLSSSIEKTARQAPLDFKAYLYEPPKQIFVDPVLVLDFQSLYPSVMIANNICYSTCLGMVGENVFESTAVTARERAALQEAGVHLEQPFAGGPATRRRQHLLQRVRVREGARPEGPGPPPAGGVPPDQSPPQAQCPSAHAPGHP